MVLSIGLLVTVLLSSSLYALATTRVPVRHSPPDVIDAACRLARLQAGERVLDIGAGDGRFLAGVLRRHPVTGVGWELSLPMVCAARLRLLASRLSGRGQIRWGDARRGNWGEFDLVYGYLMPYSMAGVRDKLVREARPGARFVSYAFPVPGWTPSERATAGPWKDPVFLYRLNEMPGVSLASVPGDHAP